MEKNTLAAAIAASIFFTFPTSAEMKGDPAAIELANQMIESIGGKELWSKIRTLYVVEKSRTPAMGDGLIAEFWRDLEMPRERYTVQNDRITFEKAWTANGGWTIVRGEFSEKPMEQLEAQELYYWPGEIYVLYHQIAAENPTYRYEKGEENGQFMVVDDATDSLLGTFWVNIDGEMYRWRHFDEADPTEYIYGPHTEFGDISFPQWGTQVNGSWSFSYVEVRGYETPPPVSFDPPVEVE